MQPEPVWLHARLAPPERPLDGQDALCPTCHHVSLVMQPFIYGLTTPDRQHFQRVEYRVAVFCTSGEGCENRWLT